MDHFEHYFWFMTDFIRTNNLSQVLLSKFINKFLCDMPTLCFLVHIKNGSLLLTTLYEDIVAQYRKK